MNRRKVKRASCAVTWCVAFAARGPFCVVHAEHRELHPEYLADDEEFLGEPTRCDDCSGSGRCERCHGSGEHEAYCYDCRTSVGHECKQCDGSGECATCHGDKFVMHIKTIEAVA
jgi:hypothetical protein